jgi:hypothetical protein
MKAAKPGTKSNPIILIDEDFDEDEWDDHPTLKVVAPVVPVEPTLPSVGLDGYFRRSYSRI